MSEVAGFAKFVDRRTVDCAMVYVSGRTWASWVDPWFLTEKNPDENWASWVRASPPTDPRQLIVSVPLIPTGLKQTAWRRNGAAGRYRPYARRLARNLVAAGLGDAVIRLSWEANGTWNPDSIGNSGRDFAEWVQFWRKTVIAMRSVPGAGTKHFPRR